MVKSYYGSPQDCTVKRGASLTFPSVQHDKIVS
jgi:hypothetical protein